MSPAKLSTISAKHLSHCRKEALCGFDEWRDRHRGKMPKLVPELRAACAEMSIYPACDVLDKSGDCACGGATVDNCMDLPALLCTRDPLREIVGAGKVISTRARLKRSSPLLRHEISIAERDAEFGPVVDISGHKGFRHR